ncbi:MAG: DNA methylase [Erysipelotrichaceae bacterium]|jgi:DNA polymerase V|nr:DNA methylase [Erysipelotrichaceae bacterium]
METKDRTYIAIDLKSFYASAECTMRRLNPLTTNLVVADTSRTEKTICLAVSPSLKAYGIGGRARLFEVIAAVKKINQVRSMKTSRGRFTGESADDEALRKEPDLKLSYLAAVPRMSLYIDISVRIYQIYLKYISNEDIHVYSIDEVFIDATDYLRLYHMDAESFARKLILEVLKETGITATAGIGTNLFLCKCAMDIVAKHIPADANGVRICTLDEMSFRKQLWTHRPLTDFWRIGRGIAKRLENEGIFTMGDIARCSLGSFQDYYNEDLLYRIFGINAELLIDHAWGYEPTSMKDIKAYRPSSHSQGIGQVLQRAYTFEEGLVIVKEMADQLSLDLIDKDLDASGLALHVGYDISSSELDGFDGELELDFYGRTVPKGISGTIDLPHWTNSSKLLRSGASEIYAHLANRSYFIRRVQITAINVRPSRDIYDVRYEQSDLFMDTQQQMQKEKKDLREEEREKKAQATILAIKKKYGKNAAVRGMDLEKGATAIDRNDQIGGHKA